MKNYFEMKTAITVLIVLVVFKILDKLFIDEQVTKLMHYTRTDENYEQNMEE